MAKTDVFMGSTTISPIQTVGEISSLLVRAKACSVATDYGPNGSIEALWFGLRIAGTSDPVYFRLPCRTDKLLRALRNDRAQAERTGWRQVLRWVQAQLAMIEAGMVQTHEVFMPYAVTFAGGEERTMFQVWESSQKLLEAPTQ